MQALLKTHYGVTNRAELNLAAIGKTSGDFDADVLVGKRGLDGTVRNFGTQMMSILSSRGFQRPIWNELETGVKHEQWTMDSWTHEMTRSGKVRVLLVF